MLHQHQLRLTLKLILNKRSCDELRRRHVYKKEFCKLDTNIDAHWGLWVLGCELGILLCSRLN